jgi:hypothetical protein
VCLNFISSAGLVSDHRSADHNIACDYENSKFELWVPILAILCDGWNFEFLVYDSGIRSIFSSGRIMGLLDYVNKPELFLPSLKESKHIFPMFSLWFTILSLYLLTGSFSEISYGIPFRLFYHGVY